MSYVRYKDILNFSANNGVILERGALDVTAQELQSAVSIAFWHVEHDVLLAYACNGHGPLAWKGPVEYEEYLDLLHEAETAEATKLAKKEHTKLRRVHFNSRRSQLVLAMIECGKAYVCAHPACTVRQALTIDHIVPLSRGGNDDLDNLQFMCRPHNSVKQDFIV